MGAHGRGRTCVHMSVGWSDCRPPQRDLSRRNPAAWELERGGLLSEQEAVRPVDLEGSAGRDQREHSFFIPQISVTMGNDALPIDVILNPDLSG